MTLEPEIYQWLRSRSLCVTGAGGRLGRRLIQVLSQGGASNVVAMDNRPPVGKLPPVEWITGDILNPADLERAVMGREIVFHLAALTHAGHSRSKPLQYFEVNGMGTAFVLEACRRAQVKRVIYASTGHVYGIPQILPVNEDHFTAPFSPYAASKLAGEVIVQSYATTFDLSGCVARMANIYGADLGSETAIGLALAQAAYGGPIVLRNLRPIRDFIHVDDVVEALIRLAAIENDVGKYQVVNVSTNRGVSIGAMAQMLARAAADLGLGPISIQETDAGQPQVVPELVLQNTRLLELTGWEPQITLEQGLKVSLQQMIEALE